MSLSEALNLAEQLHDISNDSSADPEEFKNISEQLSEVKKNLSPDQELLLTYYTTHYLRKMSGDDVRDKINRLEKDLVDLRAKKGIQFIEKNEDSSEATLKIGRYFWLAAALFAGILLLTGLKISDIYSLALEEINDIDKKIDFEVTKVLNAKDFYKSIKTELTREFKSKYIDAIYNRVDQNLTDATDTLHKYRMMHNYNGFDPRRIDEVIEVINGYNSFIRYYGKYEEEINREFFGGNNDKNYCTSSDSFKRSHYYLSKAINRWSKKFFSESYAYLDMAEEECAIFELPLLKFWLVNTNTSNAFPEHIFNKQRDEYIESYNTYVRKISKMSLHKTHREWVAHTYYLFYVLNIKNQGKASSGDGFRDIITSSNSVEDDSISNICESGKSMNRVSPAYGNENYFIPRPSIPQEFCILKDSDNYKWRAIYYFYKGFFAFVEKKNQSPLVVSTPYKCNDNNKDKLTTLVSDYVTNLTQSYYYWPTFIKPINSYLNTIADFQCLYSDMGKTHNSLTLTEAYNMLIYLDKAYGKSLELLSKDTVIKSSIVLHIEYKNRKDNCPQPSTQCNNNYFSEYLEIIDNLAQRNLTLMCRSKLVKIHHEKITNSLKAKYTKEQEKYFYNFITMGNDADMNISVSKNECTDNLGIL